MIDVFNFSLNPEADAFRQWDSGFIQAFFDGLVWQTPHWDGFDIKHVTTLPKTSVAVVVIPARHHAGMEKEVNEQLQNIERVVLFLMGDEEADFQVEQIEHPHIHIWVQNPHIGGHDVFHKLGTGYPHHMTEERKKLKHVEKDIDMFFAGQSTHQRRTELVDTMLRMESGNKSIRVEPSSGFTQGMPPAEYYALMNRTKIAPCPSGAVIPDSFRMFEALESMCVPIGDMKTPNGDVVGYWDWLFDEIVPFPQVSNWQALNSMTDEVLEGYPQNMHRITSWWIAKKRNFAYEVMEALK